MPGFVFNKTFGPAKGVKLQVKLRGVVERNENGSDAPATAIKEERKGRDRGPEEACGTASTRKNEIAGLKRELEDKKRELQDKRRESQERGAELRAAKERRVERAERLPLQKTVKTLKQERFGLEREIDAIKKRMEALRSGEAPPPVEGPVVGTLPDFAVIGASKAGTTYFYHLLVRHPHVEPAAFKELHYFDVAYDKGIEWYRQCFPTPRWKDGHKTITGEGTPGYLFGDQIPKQMADVMPEVRLICLLRNPVDRTYSAFHHKAKTKKETRTFEESVEKAIAWEDKIPDTDDRRRFLANSIYVDHLKRWNQYFLKEQMLVLKSEEFFEKPTQTLKRAFEFLGLPEWEPEGWELGEKINKGKYKEGMSPEMRRKLEEYFAPHNQRLYEYLGEDFGW